MKVETRDIFLSLVIIIFAAMAFIYSNNFSTNEFYGPDFFPKIITIFMAILGVYMLISSVLRKRKSTEEFIINKHLITKIILFIVLMAAYFSLFFVVGFIISSIIFLIVAQWIFGVKNKIILFAVSILVPIGLFVFFTQLFNIPIP